MKTRFHALPLRSYLSKYLDEPSREGTTGVTLPYVRWSALNAAVRNQKPSVRTLEVFHQATAGVLFAI